MTMTEIVATAPAHDLRTRLVAGWREAFGDHAFTVAEAARFVGSPMVSPHQAALRARLEELAGGPLASADVVTLGVRMWRYDGATADGHVLRRLPNERWCVLPTADDVRAEAPADADARLRACETALATILDAAPPTLRATLAAGASADAEAIAARTAAAADALAAMTRAAAERDDAKREVPAAEQAFAAHDDARTWARVVESRDAAARAQLRAEQASARHAAARAAHDAAVAERERSVRDAAAQAASLDIYRAEIAADVAEFAALERQLAAVVARLNDATARQRLAARRATELGAQLPNAVANVSEDTGRYLAQRAVREARLRAGETARDVEQPGVNVTPATSRGGESPEDVALIRDAAARAVRG